MQTSFALFYIKQAEEVEQIDSTAWIMDWSASVSQSLKRVGSNVKQIQSRIGREQYMSFKNVPNFQGGYIPSVESGVRPSAFEELRGRVQDLEVRT